MDQLSPLTLMSAHPWQRVAFTTYALSLSFFEGVVLDALVRGGSHKVQIFSDVSGVRAAFSEEGARHAGRDYDVEPFAVVGGGVFHPKITALVANDDCHLLVGSGNLTFGGWGGNLEVLEHLHPSFAGTAFQDAADFFEALPTSPRIRSASVDDCHILARDLRKAVQNKPRNPAIRLLHSLNAPIADQLAQSARELGGAVKLVVAAPFWDRGDGIARLCQLLGLDHVFVHAHPFGTVRGGFGANWPTRASVDVRPVEIDILVADEKPRMLHGKLMEILCRRGRMLVSGSPNMTSAALGPNKNVEACVLRMQDGGSVWKISPANPLQYQSPSDTELETARDEEGVLRAVLNGDKIAGQIIDPIMTGAVEVFHVSANEKRHLGTANLDGDSRFTIIAPDLELRSWKGDRLFLRVESPKDGAANGFLSVVGISELKRRLGAVGPRILALLAGTETPSDVAAIMAWFHENPDRLLGAMSPDIGGGSTGGEHEISADALIFVSDLTPRTANGIPRGYEGEASSGPGWNSFIGHIFSAFKERRGTFQRPVVDSSGISRGGKTEPPDEPDEDENQGEEIDEALETFEDLFALLISPEKNGKFTATAFDLTQYICERLTPEPERLKRWLDQLVNAAIANGFPYDRMGDLVAVILLLGGYQNQPIADRNTRLRLLRLKVDLDGNFPKVGEIQGFMNSLNFDGNIADVWQKIKKIRTMPEQARAYAIALRGENPPHDYPDIRNNSNEWPILEAALRSPAGRDQVIVMSGFSDVCPRCNRVLPNAEAQRLKANAIGIARNCCGRTLICTEV